MEELLSIKEKWSKKYPTALKVWENNWNEIATLFDYSPELRKIMYTTNAIESLNRSYRKYTKTKGVYPNNESLIKSLYLATINIQKKWTSRYRNWDPILNELSILFPGRI
jgi:transposase-like protein